MTFETWTEANAVLSKARRHEIRWGVHIALQQLARWPHETHSQMILSDMRARGLFKDYTLPFFWIGSVLAKLVKPLELMYVGEYQYGRRRVHERTNKIWRYTGLVPLYTTPEPTGTIDWRQIDPDMLSKGRFLARRSLDLLLAVEGRLPTPDATRASDCLIYDLQQYLDSERRRDRQNRDQELEAAPGTTTYKTGLEPVTPGAPHAYT